MVDRQIESVSLQHKPEHQPFIFEEVFEGRPKGLNEQTPKQVSESFGGFGREDGVSGAKRENNSSISIKKEENSQNVLASSALPRESESSASFSEKLSGSGTQRRSFSFIPSSSGTNPLKQIDMVVLVHGLEGAHFDMKNIKGYFASHYPELHILNSRSNEGMTNQDIDMQGFNLAAEVKKNIFEMVNEANLRSLSFVGHSLGGLVIRAALPYLKEYRFKMQTFMSLCTPHLGAISSGNPLVDIGMWYMKNFKSDQSFLQMSGTDNPSFTQTFLYNLSLDTGLSWFHNVILAASHQDKYVNFHSARIELTKELANDPKVAKITENLFSSLLKCTKIIRVNFNYNHEP